MMNLNKKVATEYGVISVIECDSVVSKSLIDYGEWAKNELSTLNYFINEDDVIVDVGAYIGTHSLAFSNMAPNGKVLSFEARKDIFKILKSNTDSHHNIEVLNCGLGSGNYTMAIEKVNLDKNENFGGLELKSIDNGDADVIEGVEIKTIDSISLDKVDFMKVDVEGMEYDVLNGSIDTIERFKPTIFLELNDANHAVNLLDFATKFDYLVFGVTTKVFNKNNFNNNADNIFSDASEVGLLFISPGKEELAKKHLCEIKDLDDVVLLLLSKVQYAYEVLAKSSSANKLSLSYYSPKIEDYKVQYRKILELLNDDRVGDDEYLWIMDGILKLKEELKIKKEGYLSKVEIKHLGEVDKIDKENEEKTESFKCLIGKVINLLTRRF